MKKNLRLEGVDFNFSVPLTDKVHLDIGTEEGGGSIIAITGGWSW